MSDFAKAPHGAAPDGHAVAWRVADATNVLTPTSGPWVDVVFLTDDDYTQMYAELGHRDGWQGMAEYMLSQWDYGQETDDASTRDVAPWGSDDRLAVVTVGGLEYVVSENYSLGYASLNRRPINT